MKKVVKVAKSVDKGKEEYLAKKTKKIKKKSLKKKKGRNNKRG